MHVCIGEWENQRKAEASAIRISAQLRRREAKWQGRERSNEKYNAGSLSQSSSACLGWTREVKTITGLPIDDTQSLTVVTDNSSGSAGAVEDTRKASFCAKSKSKPCRAPLHNMVHALKRPAHAWSIKTTIPRGNERL